jgi:hypothetical protein
LGTWQRLAMVAVEDGDRGRWRNSDGSALRYCPRHPGQFGRLRSKPPYFGVNLDSVRKILTLICG